MTGLSRPRSISPASIAGPFSKPLSPSHGCWTSPKQIGRPPNCYATPRWIVIVTGNARVNIFLASITSKIGFTTMTGAVLLIDALAWWCQRAAFGPGNDKRLAALSLPCAQSRLASTPRGYGSAGFFAAALRNSHAPRGRDESRLRSGDIIGIVSRDGRPSSLRSTSHVGLALRTSDGTLHFMHASRHITTEE